MQEITADLSTIYHQSKSTAEDYLSVSSSFLKYKFDNYEDTFENSMRLAELMAYDYRTSMISIKLQEIAESLADISGSPKDFSNL